MAKEQDKPSKILTSFGGKEVIIVSDATQRLTMNNQNMESSFQYRGLLLDEDDENLYLGFDFDFITTVISKRIVISIMDAEAFEEEEKLRAMFEGVPNTPESMN